MKKVLLTTVMSLMMCMGALAQTTYEWKKPPKATEIEIGMIKDYQYAGGRVYDLKYKLLQDDRQYYSEEQLYDLLLKKANREYAETYPKFALRNFKSSCNDNVPGSCDNCHWDQRRYDYSATIVIPDPIIETNKKISQAVNKALREVPDGSRLAIDRISSTNEEIDRETLKDQLIDMLLDKGYKVVAKEYLAKLYEEQKDWDSGIYNESTTGKENNFSAVGYYINVKVTETSLRVQVVNVSTGEYEGNATVNF